MEGKITFIRETREFLITLVLLCDNITKKSNDDKRNQYNRCDVPIMHPLKLQINIDGKLVNHI